MSETDEERRIREALNAEADRKELEDREKQEKEPREDPLEAIKRKIKEK